eukprot:1482497-Pyramimonas_sp.AAC.1
MPANSDCPEGASSYSADSAQTAPRPPPGSMLGPDLEAPTRASRPRIPGRPGGGRSPSELLRALSRNGTAPGSGTLSGDLPVVLRSISPDDLEHCPRH